MVSRHPTARYGQPRRQDSGWCSASSVLFVPRAEVGMLFDEHCSKLWWIAAFCAPCTLMSIVGCMPPQPELEPSALHSARGLSIIHLSLTAFVFTGCCPREIGRQYRHHQCCGQRQLYTRPRPIDCGPCLRSHAGCPVSRPPHLHL